VVFADSRARVEELAEGLRREEVRTFISHGSLSVDQRRQAEAAFVNERDCVIVATSTLELGLDVGDLDRVIQINAPPPVASFLQRMGRTGRRVGSARHCLFLATTEEDLLVTLGITALWRSGMVEAVVPPPRPSHIYAQQVLALVLQERGITRGDLASWLGGALDVVPSADRVAILEHMLANGILAEDQGVLGMGPRAEREFGRRHFSDVVAAFSSPMLLTVHHGVAELGSVHPTSLARRDDSPSILLLGGRNWKIVDVDWPHRRVAVVPVPEGGRSRWLGSARALPGRICRSVEKVLAGSNPGCSLSQRATVILQDMREQFAFVDAVSMPITQHRDATQVWTFAGGKANAMLAGAFRARGMTVSSSDGFCVSVRGTVASVVSQHIALIDAGKCVPEVPDRLADELKFSACLPDTLSTEILEARLSDVASLQEVLQLPRRLVTLSE
jgi:ATP-dependent Lhr-like helicase